MRRSALLRLGTATASGQRFAFRPARHQPVNFLPAGTSLEGHFTTELNRPFGDPGEPPFRPFVLRGDGAAWLGLVYQHWIADSTSVRLVLRAWLSGVRPSARAAPAVPVLSWLPSRKLLANADNPFALIRRFVAYRRVRKVHTMGPLDYPVRVRLIETPDHVAVPSLLRYARARGVKLNDVFLAALAEACDRLIPAQARPGRENLAVSSVMDLRHRWVGYHEDFGCLLGFGSVVCQAADLRDWNHLLRAVSAQRSDSTGLLWMLAAEFVSRFTPPHRATTSTARRPRSLPACPT
jgi:hypothetical protein